MMPAVPFVLAAALSMGAWAQQAAYPPGFGPSPALPQPQTSLIPTVNVAPAERFKDHGTPVAAAGFTVRAYARNLDHPRWVYALPNGDVLVAQAIVPDYALGGHTASLGLAFYEGDLFPAPYRGGAFIGQHGSWNRKPHSGYKVVFVPFANGQPAGPPQDFLSGFLSAEGKARGRPVGVAVDKAGALLVVDDVANVVWRVTPKGN